MFLKEDLQKRGKGIAGCSLLICTEVSFITCNRISSGIHLTSEKQKEQPCNHYYVLNYNAYCSTQIQDLQMGNNMIVNTNYRLFGCKTMQLADVLENNGPPSSRLQGVRFLVGSSLQPKMRWFNTRHSSLSIDANNLLSTNRTTSKYAFKVSLTLKLSYHDALIQSKSPQWEEGWYTSPRCSCTVTYAFHDSSDTILITCHHKSKSHISADTALSEYPNHLVHHVNSDHFCLHITHSRFPAQSRISSQYGLWLIG
jgi:hypothetical protein